MPRQALLPQLRTETLQRLFAGLVRRWRGRAPGGTPTPFRVGLHGTRVGLQWNRAGDTRLDNEIQTISHVNGLFSLRAV